MEIHSLPEFLHYFQRIHERTAHVVACIPADKMNWSPLPGKFTLADQVRHIACINRWMYAENACFRPSRFNGNGPELADGKVEVLLFFEEMHRQSMAIFEKLTPENLMAKTSTPAGTPIILWKWLRAMVEHEVHHRSQIYLSLSILGVETQPLFGLTAEQVASRAIFEPKI